MATRSRGVNKETAAIIGAIEHATAAAQIVADQVSRELVTHTQHDDVRFEKLTVLVESVATDVKSLIETRKFGYAVWWTLTKIGGGVLLLTAGAWAVFTYFSGKP
jgi:hypothetical protein